MGGSQSKIYDGFLPQKFQHLCVSIAIVFHDSNRYHLMISHLLLMSHDCVKIVWPQAYE